MAGLPTTKYRRIYEHLRDAICQGSYEVGQRVPTEAELGSRFGVSRLTVVRALRDLEQRGYLVRRRGVGSFVGEWREQRSRLFGLLVPRPHRGVFAVVAEEICRQSEIQSYGLLLGGSMTLGKDVTLPRVEAFCEQVVARKVAGVFYGSMELPADQMHLNAQVVERLHGAGLAVVLIDRDIHDYPKRSPYDLVAVDNRGGARIMTDHLLERGYRRIEFLAHDYTVSTITARVAGYKEALVERGIMPDPSWVHRWDLEDRDCIRKLMQHSRAEAFVCENDRVAERFMHNLAVLGVRVPEDVAIVGFDDIDMTSHLPTPLTTMRQPLRAMGEIAVKVMTDRITRPELAPRETLLSCELIVRESCGAHGARSTAPERSESVPAAEVADGG